MLGALFGFFTYATYDLANLAALRDWSVLIAVGDIAWGMVLCALVVGSCRNIGTHYDLGNDFYGLFLGSTISYSGDIFKSAVRVGHAQGVGRGH